MGGETSRRLELLPRKKGKVRVRVRVVDESMKTRNFFCLTTKDSQITEKMSLPDISLLLGTSLGEYPYEIVSQKKW